MKTREEEKENEAEYEPVGDPQSGMKRRLFKRQRLWKLVPMVGLLLCAVTSMIIHHIFNSYLNEKLIDPGSTELPSLLQNQRNVNVIGTVMAHGARILLSMAIGATFAQMFWEILRARMFTIAQVDALVRCRQSPFHPSAHRAAAASFALFIASLTASATSLVVVLSPGSLTINSEFQRSGWCTVPTVPAEVTGPDYTNVNGGFESALLTVTSSIRELNSYVPPYQASLSSTCGDGTTLCSYNVTFAGPALDCIDITNDTNFTTFLTPTGDPPNQAFTIWDATSNNGSTIGLTILSRDLEKGSWQANNCTAYNATYDVGVSSQEGSATVQVWSVALGSTLASTTETGFFANFYAFYATFPLATLCQAGPNVPSDCQWGSFFLTTPTGNSTFSDTVPHFVTSFMQNVTLSLLSGNIDYDFGNDTATNLQYVQSTCSSIVTVYIYNSTRLLATYGIAIAVSTLVTAYGCYLILRNDVERDFLLFQLTSVALIDAMLSLDNDFEKRVQGKTLTQLFRIDHTRHKLVLVSPKKGSPLTAPVKSGAHAVLSALTTYRSKTLLLVLGAVGCMVLNHAYYLYLNGRVPNPSPHVSFTSGWTLNQTIASDIGIALAFAGQTMLAVAIGTSCTQLFWRVIRNQGHTINEVDSLIKAQTTPFSRSLFRALGTSIGVSALALLAALTSLISILSPGSIKVAPDHKQTRDCTVLTPRNLSALTTESSSFGGNYAIVSSVAALGSYQAPINTCGSESPPLHCSYSLELVGPGLDCEDVTELNFSSEFVVLLEPNTTNLYNGQFLPQDITNLWQMAVQTWDVERSVMQNVSCTGVLRSYTVSVSHGTASTSNVTESRIVSLVHGNISQPDSSFADNYMLDIMNVLNSNVAQDQDGSIAISPESMLAQSGGIGAIQLDGNVTWSQNMSRALEDFAQNATLSLLSGKVLTFNPDVPDILENVTTTCTFTFTAYEYSPLRLFLTYGIGIFITILCALWGLIVIRQNGVEESMDFSRFLRAVLNERMYDARDSLDKNTIVKADETAEGSFAPLDS